MLKAAAAAVADVIAPAIMPRASAAMYSGTRKEPPPRARKGRVEEKGRQHHGRRPTAYAAVHALQTKGADLADLARMVGVSRRTVYRYPGMGCPPARKRPGRRGRPERAAHEAYLVPRWNEGCHHGRRPWRELRAAGSTGGETPVARFVARLRRGAPIRRTTRASGGAVTSAQGPTARPVALLLLRHPRRPTREHELHGETRRQRDTLIAPAAALARDSTQMPRDRAGGRLDAWTTAATAGEVAALRRVATGLTKDDAAVEAGLTSGYSNGQTEGHMTRLKLVRRAMYGRGHSDLLHRRVLLAA